MNLDKGDAVLAAMAKDKQPRPGKSVEDYELTRMLSKGIDCRVGSLGQGLKRIEALG